MGSSGLHRSRCTRRCSWTKSRTCIRRTCCYRARNRQQQPWCCRKCSRTGRACTLGRPSENSSPHRTRREDLSCPREDNSCRLCKACKECFPRSCLPRLHLLQRRYPRGRQSAQAPPPSSTCLLGRHRNRLRTYLLVQRAIYRLDRVSPSNSQCWLRKNSLVGNPSSCRSLQDSSSPGNRQSNLTARWPSLRSCRCLLCKDIAWCGVFPDQSLACSSSLAHT